MPIHLTVLQAMEWVLYRHRFKKDESNFLPLQITYSTFLVADIFYDCRVVGWAGKLKMWDILHICLLDTLRSRRIINKLYAMRSLLLFLSILGIHRLCSKPKKVVYSILSFKLLHFATKLLDDLRVQISLLMVHSMK